YRLTRPYVGLSPTTPQNAAGCRTEPPVSLPRAMETYPAATAAAEPPELPPVTRVRSCGFSTGPYAEFSDEEPIANSSRFVLPTITPPASRSLLTAVASNGERYPSSMREPQVVGRPSVAMLSLTATGAPPSGPGRGTPRASASGSEMQAFSPSYPR